MALIHVIVEAKKAEGATGRADVEELKAAFEEALDDLGTFYAGENDTEYELTVRGIGTSRAEVDESKRARDEQRKAAQS